MHVKQLQPSSTCFQVYMSGWLWQTDEPAHMLSSPLLSMPAGP